MHGEVGGEDEGKDRRCCRVIWNIASVLCPLIFCVTGAIDRDMDMEGEIMERCGCVGTARKCWIVEAEIPRSVPALRLGHHHVRLA